MNSYFSTWFRNPSQTYDRDGNVIGNYTGLPSVEEPYGVARNAVPEAHDVQMMNSTDAEFVARNAARSYVYDFFVTIRQAISRFPGQVVTVDAAGYMQMTPRIVE